MKTLKALEFNVVKINPLKMPDFVPSSLKVVIKKIGADLVVVDIEVILTNCYAPDNHGNVGAIYRH